MPFKILLCSPFREEIVVGKFEFSKSHTLAESDAMLCEWAPSAELASFDGPKAWYCCEPRAHCDFRSPEWQRYMSFLQPAEFFFHGHPDNRYRVPHITHVTDISVHRNAERLKKGVAIVSNIGGAPWRRTSDMARRLRFVTNPRVDLYGRRDCWQNFRSGWFSKPAPPLNYKGEVEGLWTNDARFDLMSKYKAGVCFENTSEPYYFTEKFVGAVQAGCIPVYHAHDTVRDSILKGAAWVDPSQFNYDVDRTLEFALNENLEEYCAANERWLKSAPVAETHLLSVFERIGEILQQQSLTQPRRTGNQST